MNPRYMENSSNVEKGFERKRGRFGEVGRSCARLDEVGRSCARLGAVVRGWAGSGES